jgi:hypothetical protein
MFLQIASRDASLRQFGNSCLSEIMLPDLYRSFETSTLKDLVSYGDPADEEPRSDGLGWRDDEASPRQRVPGGSRRPWSPLRRAKGKWFRLGWRAIARAKLR